MDDDLDYGPCLSGVEYDRRIVQLYDPSPSETTRDGKDHLFVKN